MTLSSCNKALGKLGNIVAETLWFLSTFPCLPTSGNIVAETKFASREAKMFPNKFRNIFVAETMFPSFPTCFQMFSTRETLFSRSGKYKKCFFHYSGNINNILRFVRTNVSQKMFPSLPTVGNMTKHRQETMLPQQCFLVCPGQMLPTSMYVLRCFTMHICKHFC